MKLVYVEWVDSYSPADTSWMSEDMLMEYVKEPMIIQDVGWVLKRTPIYLIIVGGYGTSESMDHSYHRPLMIPKCAIRRLVYLEAPPPLPATE